MRRDLVWKVLVWGMIVAIGSAIISCEEPIKPFFKDKVKQKSKSVVKGVKTVAYKHNDKIMFTWAKVKNAASYYVYEFKQRTGTVASRDEPDSIKSSRVTKHIIKISKKERKRMNTRYVIVQARDKEGKVLFESEMTEGKTLGEPIVIKEAGHVEETFYSITFRWASVEGASKYSVERKEKGTSYKAMSLPKRMGESWKFVDEDVAADTKYDYKITAIVMNGEKVVGKSEHYPVSAKTAKQAAPSAVKNFEASEYVYGDRVLLVWEEPDAVEGFDQGDLRYTIQRREKSADNAKKFESIGLRMKSSELTKPKEAGLKFEEIFIGRSAKSLVYQDKDVDGHEYEYQVIASYNVDKGKPSEVVRGAVIPQAQNIRAEKSDDGVKINWEVPSDFLGTVEVHRSVGGVEFKKIADDITGVEYTNKVSLETSYWYKVRLVAAIENVSEFHQGEFSAKVEYKHEVKYKHKVEYKHEKKKERKFNFTVSSGKRKELKFIWDIPDDILESVEKEDFSIERLEDDGTASQKVVLSTPVSIDKEEKQGEAGLAVNDASSFTQGLYRIVWENDGIKHYSKIVKGDILRAPKGVRATKGEYADRIEVKWKPSVGAKKYEVFLARSGTSLSLENKFIDVDAGEEVTTEYTRNIKPPDNNNPEFRGIAYDIRVDAIGEDENVDRAQSTVVQGKTFGPAGMAVQVAQGSSRDEITITWNAVENADTYLVVRKTKGTSDEFEIARISAVAGNNTYTYDDSVKNPKYLTGDVSIPTLFNSKIYEYKIVPEKRGILSPMGSSRVEGFLEFKEVTGVQASDVNVTTDTGKYVAKHGDTIETSASVGADGVNRIAGISYATKITWDNVPGVDVYYIYRMDFNELENFWRKIGERDAVDGEVFFDTKALLLREYRAMYWVVAVNEDDSRFDISLHGDPKRKPTNTLITETMKDFSRFDAGKQNENIKTMSAASNVDVGSRWITAKEYLNWSIAVIGEAVYDLDYDTSSYGYGSRRDSWKFMVTFTLEDYSLGAKALNLRSREKRQEKKSTELVVNSQDGLRGTFAESCPSGDGGYNCLGAKAGKRLGAYMGKGGNIRIDSPYGTASLQISGSARKVGFWTKYIKPDGRELYYNFNRGSITFRWLEKNSTITKSDNTDTQGPLNPYVTPIRFNRNYAEFLRAVYGSSRE